MNDLDVYICVAVAMASIPAVVVTIFVLFRKQ